MLHVLKLHSLSWPPGGDSSGCIEIYASCVKAALSLLTTRGRLVASWKLTVQFAAQQLQAEAQALDGGPLRVDPDVAGQQGAHGPQLRGVVVLIPEEGLRRHGRQNEAKKNCVYLIVKHWHTADWCDATIQRGSA